MTQTAQQPSNDAGHTAVARARAAIDAQDYAAAAAACSALVAVQAPCADALALMGEIEYRQGRKGEAEAWLDKAVAADRRHAHANWLLGNVYQDDGKLDRAISAFRRALRAAPQLAEAHNDLGTAYHAKGWHAEAEQCYRQTLALQPDHAIALENLGTALRAQGKLSEARRAFVEVLKLRVRALWRRLLGRARPAPARRDPASADARSKKELAQARALFAQGDFADAARIVRALLAADEANADLHHLLGNIVAAGGERAAAIGHIERAIALRSSSPEFYVSLGNLRFEQRDFPGALDCYHAALGLDPGYGLATANIGLVLHELGFYQEAEQVYAQSILSEPDTAAVHANFAGTLLSLGKLADAEAAALKALALNPRSIHGLIMIGSVRQEQGRIDEAEATFLRGLEIQPEHADLLRTLGKLRMVQHGDLDGCTQLLMRSLQSQPANPATHISYAQVLLMRQRFAEGWEEYEWRKREIMRMRVYTKYPHPEWDGSALGGRSILVVGEQGLGDEIMFASCLAEVRAQARRCALYADGRLLALFRRSFPDLEVHGGSHVQAGEAFPALEGIDVQVAAGSLPKVFRRSIDDFPRHAGYLVADPAKVERWAARLATLGPGLKVGLSWKGGTPLSGRTRRTLTLGRLDALLRVAGVHWISLQYGDCRDELDAHAQAGGSRMHHWQEAIDDLDETAALMCALDLRISVCNTQVHLAGALGREVWVLAPLTPDWRYGATGESMPWYPSARLFRQRAAGDWSAPLDDAARALAGRAG